MMMMKIDRCICMERTFADLLAQARRDGLDVEGVMALAGEKAKRCGLCRPYVRTALATGQTVFGQVMAEPGRE